MEGEEQRISVDGPAFDVEPTAANRFAWVRTRLAMERTLMAWIRTSTAFIGFGFTIFEFFDRLPNPEGRALHAPHIHRYLGLALIAAGIVALGIAMLQYGWMIRELWRPQLSMLSGPRRTAARTPVPWLAGGLLVVGLVVFTLLVARTR